MLSAFLRFGNITNPQGGSFSVHTEDTIAAAGLFGLRHIPERLYDYFLSPGFSVVIHFPLLIVALFFWRRFLRSHKNEAIMAVITSATLFFVMVLFESVGEWCYGPRYVLSVLPVLALPVLLWVKDVRGRQLSLIAGLLLVSMFFQWHIHTRPFFMFYEVEGIVAEVIGQELPSSFSRKHQSVFAWEMNQLLDDPKRFNLEGPFGNAFVGWPVKAKQAFKEDLKKYLYAEGSNFLFFPVHQAMDSKE